MIRVRFAPSPTGFLHIGGARTFIFNWLFARSQQGQVVLRIDDTDVERSTEQSLDSIFGGLRWLDLAWDEEHRQSQRRQHHIDAANALLTKGAAYRDFTPQGAEAGPPADRSQEQWLCNPGMRELSTDESDRRAAAGEPFVIRFRVHREQENYLQFRDHVYKKQSRKITEIEDFALLRSDGNPTYHLASTVDDADLSISHVIRGQDHLTNTYKHILIFEALGAETPEFAHLPLLLGPDQSKLSKRKHGPIVSVTTYGERGFLPEAFINYLCLLGWSPKNNQDYLRLKTIRELFDLKAINRVNAVVQFDEGDDAAWADPKAIWLNSQHLRSNPAAEIQPFIDQQIRAAGWWRDEFSGERRDWYVHTCDILRARYQLLTDYPARAAAYFSDEFEIDEKATKNLDKDRVRDLLPQLADRIAALDEFTEESIEAALRQLAEDKEVKAGLLINGSRAALSGQAAGPSAFAVFTAVGRERVLRRLRAV